MIIPRLFLCASVVGVLVLAACGSPDSTPIPNLTGTPRPDMPVPVYTQPDEPINRLNADQLAYLGRLDPDSSAPSSIISAAFAPNGLRLATLDAQHITLWDLVTGRSIFSADHHGAQAVFYSSDKTEIYTIRGDGAIGIYGDDGSEKTVLIGHETYNGRYAYDVTNGWLALGGTDGTIRVWDVASREAKATLTAHTDEINLLAFSADGTHLASVGFDGQLIWWDWASRTKLWAAKIGDIPPLRLVVSSDTSQVALATDTQLMLYNTADGTPKASLPLPVNGAEDVLRYTPDSQTLVAASRHAPMTLWNAKTGQLIGQFPNVTGNRVSTAFSPGGELMLMSILDQEKGLSIWDLTQASAKGIPILEIASPSKRIVGVVWSDDGYLIALLGATGEVYVMGIPKNDPAKP